MSVSKRLIDLARSELNSLLDRAGESGDHDGSGSSPINLSALSDDELTAEIERRHRAKMDPGGTRRAPEPARPRVPPDEVALAYAALEVPTGSDFQTVRRAYRTLMRKYHPDRHTSTPDKQKTANELAQKLTHAYEILEKRLR